MALVKCKECGKPVSTKAKTCPNCGAKAPKKTSVVTWFILALGIFVVYITVQSPTSSVSNRDVQKVESPKPISDAEKAAKTLELTKKLKSVPESDFTTNHSMYSRLVKLNPNEQKFKDKQGFYAKKLKEAENERIRLANLNKTGIWKIGSYVDDFGESTGERFISTTLKGTFSNTATQDSRLRVRFLISNSNDINFKLFEYTGNNPVKNYGIKNEYKVLVQDKDGKRLRLKAINHSDRLTLGKLDSQKLHSAFLKGGKVQFVVIEEDTPTTQYNFTILNADFYANAARKLNEN